MRRLCAALVHHPVHDRQRAIVTTAITNLDLHDIARSAHTYGLSDFFVVHPISAQRELAERVREHWVSGSGARRIPDRSPALGIIRVVPDVDSAIAAIGPEVEIWTTSALERARSLTFPAARERLQQPGPPVLILFGTGWGLADALCARADQEIEPIRSPRADGYNHLSVRAAAAICFDRLCGVRTG
ncbi:MAG TPA: RNA methyltransferase [Polyangiaceae bacterium]|nr:RNA methyltransferase [Polyangiaceae bacterium]